MAYLSVFEGGFTLDAGQSVVSDGDRDDDEGVDTIESLLSKSLVAYGDEGRFQLLESVREYAYQQLSIDGRFRGSGPQGTLRAFQRHWTYYGRLDEAAAAAVKADASNLVVAAQRAISANDTEAAAHCVLAAWAFLLQAGPFRVGVNLADLLLSMPDLSLRGKALGHWIAGCARELLGDVEQARSHFLTGLECLALVPDANIEARLHTALGARQCVDGELDAAARSLEVADQRAIAAGDDRLRILVGINQGRRLVHQGRLLDARTHYESALQLCRQHRDRRLEGGILGNLGVIHHNLGRLTEARALYRQSVEIAREVGDHRWEGNGLCNLGLLCQEQGDWAEARESLEAAEAVARAIGHVALEYTVLCNLGILAESEGRLADATSAFQQSVSAARRAGDRRAEGQFLGYLASALARQEDCESAMQHLSAAEARLVEMSDQLSLAFLACQRVEVLSIAGKLDDASRALDAARAMLRHLGAGPDSELARRLSRAESVLAHPMK